MAGTINQYANQVLAQYPSPNTITITIEEVSNGSIIRIGGLIRLAPSNENLMEHVGAAYTQYFLNKEKK